MYQFTFKPLHFCFRMCLWFRIWTKILADRRICIPLFTPLLTPEFRWTSFEKRNNLDELINIPTEAEERYITQISFTVHDPNIKTGTIQNSRQKLQPIHAPLCFQIPRIRSISAQIHNPCAFWGQIRRSENHSPPLLFEDFEIMHSVLCSRGVGIFSFGVLPG